MANIQIWCYSWSIVTIFYHCRIILVKCILHKIKKSIKIFLCEIALRHDISIIFLKQLRCHVLRQTWETQRVIVVIIVVHVIIIVDTLLAIHITVIISTWQKLFNRTDHIYLISCIWIENRRVVAHLQQLRAQVLTIYLRRRHCAYVRNKCLFTLPITIYSALKALSTLFFCIITLTTIITPYIIVLLLL